MELERAIVYELLIGCMPKTRKVPQHSVSTQAQSLQPSDVVDLGSGRVAAEDVR